MSDRNKANLQLGHLIFDIGETKSVDDELIIEGYANPTTIDRGNEFMPKSCWDLTNYGKTGIILYNHDRNLAIGKAIEVRATDKGLYLKCRISKSKDPFISKIRDLIRERILNAFSVGYYVLDEMIDQAGVRVLKSVDLFEISIVTVPMNQDAIFEISSKELKALPYAEAVHKILEFKGAPEALAYRDKAEEAGIDLMDLAQSLAKSLDLKRQEALDLLSGNKSIDETQTKALDDLFKKKKEDDKPANDKPGKDPKESDDQDPGADEQDLDGKKPPIDGQIEGKEEQEDPFAALKPKSQPLPVPAYQSILIPLSTAATQDEAIAIAQSFGTTALEVFEDADGFVIAIRDAKDFLGELSNMTIAEGVFALVGILKTEAGQGDGQVVEAGEGGTDDDSPKSLSDEPAEGEGEDVQKPDGNAEEDGSKKVDDTQKEPPAKEEESNKDKPNKAKKAAEGLPYEELKALIESNEDPDLVPSFVTKPDLWEKAKAACLASHGELRYDLLVHQYNTSGNEADGKSLEIYGRDTTEIDQNPVQAAGTQTNVLLGALITEIQGMREDLRDMCIKLSEPKTVSEPVTVYPDGIPETLSAYESEDPEMQAMAKQLDQIVRKNEQFMKMLGVSK